MVDDTSPKSLTLRSIHIQDAEQVAAWLEEASETVLTPSADYLAEVAQSAQDEVRGVWLGEVLVGAVALQTFEPPARPTRASLAIVLSPAVRGRGLARPTLDLLLDLARELGLTRLWLEVHATNHAAIRAYEAAGFAAEQPRGEVLRYGRTL